MALPNAENIYQQLSTFRFICCLTGYLFSYSAVVSFFNAENVHNKSCLSEKIVLGIQIHLLVYHIYSYTAVISFFSIENILSTNCMYKKIATYIQIHLVVCQFGCTIRIFLGQGRFCIIRVLP